jgi:hypothetical protein
MFSDAKQELVADSVLHGICPVARRVEHYISSVINPD